jgi:hypothetical protein
MNDWNSITRSYYRRILVIRLREMEPGFVWSESLRLHVILWYKRWWLLFQYSNADPGAGRFTFKFHNNLHCTVVSRQEILAQCILSSAYYLTHSWGWIGSRAFPHAGGPAHCTSRAPICSEIPNRFSLEPQGVQLMWATMHGEVLLESWWRRGYVLEREDLRSSASPFDDWSFLQIRGGAPDMERAHYRNLTVRFQPAFYLF